ncbi:uncharacterized protein LOC124116704 [Haliotis rufescens]|uniref:uncharacterized protein LOC124116704 n=1 Tax=Haliotis rufescens TaxID=6454 RepID=UPI00201F1EBB|nr:uncharacterized protein LOC124116704 [Haliotis rufescens]
MSSGMKQDGFQNFEHNSEKESRPDDMRGFAYESSLDSIRSRINDIWQDDPSKYDVLTPTLCNICLTSELLQKRLSSVTSADILAGIAVGPQTEKSLINQKEQPEFTEEDDFFCSPVFGLHQECTHDTNLDHTDDIQQGDARTVGFGRNEGLPGVCYNDPFDPRLTFAGLQDIVFPNAQFVRPDDQLQDNICLAVDDVGDIVHEYLNKYHDFLDFMRSRSPCGNWVHKPEAVLPAKFASYELWLAAKNEASIENEVDEDCRLLASKVTSQCVKRLWLDLSSYTPSTSDDQDVFSQQGSVSCGSSSPRDSSSAVNEDLTSGYSDQWSHYKQLHYYPVGTEPNAPTSELWAERNFDSIKDFVPRVSYGFNLPVPDVVKEESLVSLADTVRDEPDDDLDIKTDRHTSRLFDIWCVPEQNDGQGDGSPNRSEWSPRDVQPPEQHLSPEIGLQIPLLVSTKRRERPVRGVRNARRSNFRDYQVTFVDDVQYSDPCRYSEPEAVSNSRATISDTRVWTVKSHGEDGRPPHSKHGFSRSETHQEYRDDHVKDYCYPVTQRIELSAHSEPFFPRWPVSDDYSFTGCESEKRLNKIEEELTDIKTSPQQRHENRNSLSPCSQPFMPKTPSPEQMKRSPVVHQELPFHLDDNDRHQQNRVCDDQSNEFLNSPESQKSTESYQQWSPAHESENSPVKEYKLFDTKKSFYDNPILDKVKPLTSVGKSASKPCGLIGNMRFTGNGWKKIYEKEHTVDDLWNIWINSPETKIDGKDQSWTNGDAKLLKPLSASSQSSMNHLQPKLTSVPSTVWQRTSQSVWTKPDAPVQSQHSLIPHQSYQTLRSLRPNLASYSRTSHQGSMSSPCDNSDKIPQARIIRPQTPHQLELKPSLEVFPRGALAEPRLRQYQTVTSPWTAAEHNVMTNLHQPQENTRFIQSQGIGAVRPNQNISFVPNQMTCVPTPQPYDYRNMVVLQPHQKQPEPRPTLQPTVLRHGFSPQPPLKPTAYHTFGPSLASTLHRVPFEQHSRLHPSIISRPNAAFAPPAGFAPAIPAQTYRHVTVAANYNPPKLVAVPTFDARPRPRYYTSFLNFNNHNDAYSSDSELSESSVDPVGSREDDQDVFDRHGRARPIRANPANLIHLT